MGKPTGKKNNTGSQRNVETIGANTKSKQSRYRTSKDFDEDTKIFINMSQELKEEGNKIFQKHDHKGALLKYEKALRLLPRNHIDVAYLRTNMASCYMQMGLAEYIRAINECNLALEVSPMYSKALLKRARCYEALNRLDLALRDVHNVLSIEPNNLNALEVLESVKKAMSDKGINYDEKLISLAKEEHVASSQVHKVVKPVIKNVKKEKVKKMKKIIKGERKNMKDKLVVEERKIDPIVKDKEVVVKTIEEEKLVTNDVKEEKLVAKTFKLVLGEDIRWAQFPVNCSIGLLRDIVRDRFPGVKGVLMKYKDQEGDMITITSTDELRLAESSRGSKGSIMFYIVEVDLDQEPAYEGMKIEQDVHAIHETMSDVAENGNVKKDTEVKTEKRPASCDDWIIQFARLFKNHVGFDFDSCLNLHELGMKLYSEAMEDIVTIEEAQDLFVIAEDKFQEMAALAVFNCGNVHLSKARKRVFFSDYGSKESILSQITNAYEWAKKEYVKAGMRYQEALKIKPNFYEGLLALAQQQFEQAKLCWYHAVGSKIDLESGPSEEVLDLYNKAEENMERGMEMWNEMKKKSLNRLLKVGKEKALLKKMRLDGLLRDLSPEEVAEQTTNMNSQIYLLWGTMIYERSIIEYKLELPTWEECLEVAVEKFESAGASPIDIAVMIKNHISNETAVEGLGFKIDEIVQAWNEMYDAKRWEIGVPSFMLEPLFRRKVPKLHDMLEHV